MPKRGQFLTKYALAPAAPHPWVQRTLLLGGLSEGTRAAFLAATDAQKREKDKTGRQGGVNHQRTTMAEGAGAEVAAWQRLLGSKDHGNGWTGSVLKEKVCREDFGIEAIPDASRINGIAPTSGAGGCGVGGKGGVDTGERAGVRPAGAEEEEEEARRRDELMTDVVDQLRFEKEQKATEVNT